MHSVINILGLTIGITCFILIFLYVQNELSYDSFHAEHKRIFRIHNTVGLAEGTYTYPTCNSLLPVMAGNELPEVEQYVRIFSAGGGFGNELIIQSGNNFYSEAAAYLVDSTFFEVFSFAVMEGNGKSALSEPNSVVLTATSAMRYLPGMSGVGEMIKITGQQEFPLKVTAIVADPPPNSHFQFNMLISMSTVRQLEMADDMLNSWDNDGFYSYLLLKDPNEREAVDKELVRITSVHVGEETKNRHNPFLFPLDQIHLRSNLRNELKPNGNIQEVYIFILVAIFIILIASVNYVNLTTAVAARRSMEVGVRKVFGATRNQLVPQYLGESVMVTLLSAILSPLLVELLIPLFSRLSGSDISYSWYNNGPLILTVLSVVLFIGIIAGLYPAFVLSSFRPIVILKGVSRSGRNLSETFRKVLVVGQFAISIILIIAAWTIYRQIEFINKKELGYDRRNVMIIRNSANTLTPKLGSFKAELKSNPSVINVAASFSTPGGLRPLIGARSRFTADGDDMNLAGVNVDFDYMKTLGIKILEGRDFDPDLPTDTMGSVILNKKAMADLGIASQPIGENIEVRFNEEVQNRKVIGIIDNINFEPLYRPTEGAFFAPVFPFYRYIFVRIDDWNREGTVSFIEEKWKEFVPQEPFVYSFLEDDMERLYSKEDRLQKVITYFSLLAIFIALLGLYGLSSYAILQRTREIGIRKVLGANTSSLVLLFSNMYVRLVIISILVAWPAAWFLVDLWMENFIYHTSISADVFLLSGIAVLVLAMATITVKVFEISRIDPVISLKYE